MFTSEVPQSAQHALHTSVHLLPVKQHEAWVEFGGFRILFCSIPQLDAIEGTEEITYSK